MWNRHASITDVYLSGVMQESNQDLSSRDGLMLPDLRGCMIPGGGGTFEGLDVLKIEPQDICDQEMTM